jgi:hypothetical protein
MPEIMLTTMASVLLTKSQADDPAGALRSCRCARDECRVWAGYRYVAVGVAFVDRWVDAVRRIPPVCRRRLTLLRLTLWAAAREAAVTQLQSAVINPAISRSLRQSRRLHGHFLLGFRTHWVGESDGGAKPQVSDVDSVRVSGK